SSSFQLFVAPSFRGRNDMVTTATVIGDVGFNKGIGASISPFTDPSSTAPDSDYFSFTAPAGSVLDIRTNTNSDPLHPNPFDTVIEILDSNGNRFQTCRNLEDDGQVGPPNIVKDATPSAFDDDCLNDDDPVRGT